MARRYSCSILFMFLFLKLCAQNYEPFLTDTVTIYRAQYSNFAGELLGARFDSVSTSGTDSIFWSYHVFEDTSEFQSGYGCVLNRMGNCWMGFGMIKRLNGDYIFLNRAGDSIILKSLVSINDAWVFYRYADGTFIEAKVIADTFMNYGGISDSIHIISLMRNDSLGNALIDPWNGKTLWLSKSNGLLKTPAIYRFPNGDSSVYRVFFQVPTEQEYYNHEIGDILVVSHYEYYGAVKFWSIEYLNKWYSIDSSDVTYVKALSYINGAYTIDTVTEIVNHSLAPAYSLNYFSYEAHDWGPDQGYSEVAKYDSCLKTIIVTSSYTEFFQCDSGYYSYPFEFCDYWYSDIIGISSLANYTCYSDPPGTWQEFIHGYRKGSLVCGNPPPLGFGAIDENISVKIYPNPASNVLTILFPEFNFGQVTISLHALSGKPLLNFSPDLFSSPHEFKLDLSEFGAGIYILTLISKDQVISTKIIKLP